MPSSKEKEDLPGLGPVALSESKVPTPATNRARQIGDSLENLLSGVQKQACVAGGCGKQESGFIFHGLHGNMFFKPISVLSMFLLCHLA